MLGIGVGVVNVDDAGNESVSSEDHVPPGANHDMLFGIKVAIYISDEATFAVVSMLVAPYAK